MSFNLSNISASFQGYINKIFAEKPNIFVILYLDNILIYTEDPAWSHMKAVYWIPEQLQKYDFFANLKKCWFH